MIGFHEIYKLVEAMVPFYFALTLGYGSIRWWQIFSPAECDTLNRLVSYFVFPFFAFRFTLNTDPYSWNYRAIAGDVLAKAIIICSLVAWANNNKGSYTWAITSFSLTTLTNALVMGVPLLDAMYGNWAGDLVVQLAVFQAVTWLTLFLFVLELSKALEEMREEPVQVTPRQEINANEEEVARNDTDDVMNTSSQELPTDDLESGKSAEPVEVTRHQEINANEEEVARNDTDDVMKTSSQELPTDDLESGKSAEPVEVTPRQEINASEGEVAGSDTDDVINTSSQELPTNDLESGKSAEPVTRRISIRSLMKVVGVKLALNPNSYASFIGITWALVTSRYDFKLPGILDGCVYIMARSSPGMAMFSMGMFMATQERALACGTKLTLFGMVLRFVAGPVTMAIGCLAVGLRGDVLRVAIIQAAIPQSITSFVYAREYGLHAEVISTAVIFGMLVSLPLLVLYNILLKFAI